jgi:hypothetical protein
LINLKNDNPENIKRYLESLKNSIGHQYLDLDKKEEFKVNIRPCSSVTPSLFKPDPLNQYGYIAHSQTIAALKKDIFMAGANFDELEQLIKCEECKSTIDIQFWHFCPHCGEKFDTDSIL